MHSTPPLTLALSPKEREPDSSRERSCSLSHWERVGVRGKGREWSLAIAILTTFLFLHSPSLAEEKETPIPRTVLCLYGFASGDPARSPVWPPDTYSGQMLQMALEWMGYKMEFHDVGKGRPPETLNSEVCAVILDSALDLPFAEEAFYSQWIIKQRDHGLKLLFIGAYPGNNQEKRQEMTDALGIRGSTSDIIGVKSAKFRTLDKSMVDETLLPRPRTNNLVSAQAPEGAKVWLSVLATDKRDIEMPCDLIYTATWGGALLEPYLFFKTSPEDVRAVIDPFTFLATILPPSAFPVPDATTRDGLRMFLTHIDGDGFTTLSKKHLNVTCAEIIRDEFLKKYPFPVTVSVIQSEVQSLLKEQNPDDRKRFEDIARSIFALPNVQGASHAFSHPFVWMPDLDIEGGRGYATQWLEFADPKIYPAFDLHREIEGSVKYIQDTLMPPGKKLEVFLWSGNCRPSGEALRMVSSLGLESLNGGNTMINRRAEGIAGISSTDTLMDGEVQVYSPMQNEFVYTNGFTGPLYGGYRLVIDTFKRTGEPRRVKPVNAYYHFYSVQSGESQAALKDVYDWCLAQPLHSMTARDFVRLAKDSRATSIASAGPKRWIARNAGHCRTFRVPASWSAPNLALSKGVTGFIIEGDQMYLHTDGRAEVVLDFNRGDSRATPPWLVSSSGEISFEELSAKRITGSIRDLRDSEVVFSGLKPSSVVSMKTSDENTSNESTERVDKQGHIRLRMPPACLFTITLSVR